MSKSSSLVSHYKNHPTISTLLKAISEKPKGIQLKGVSGSMLSLIGSIVSNKGNMLFITSDYESASYLYNDFTQLMDKKSVFLIPSSFRRLTNISQTDVQQVIMRTDSLKQLNENTKNTIFITYTEAVMEKIPDSKTLEENSIKLKVEEDIDLYFVRDMLKEMNFQETDSVHEPGHFSIRGSILDVFSFSNDEPFRVDFFGDTVESIRTFDLETQLSKESLDNVTIIPRIRAANNNHIAITELDIFENIWIDNPFYIKSTIEAHYEKLLFNNDFEEIEPNFIDGDEFVNTLGASNYIVWQNTESFKVDKTVEFNSSPQPLFHKKFSLIEENIKDNISKNYSIYILSNQENQLERIAQIFKDRESDVQYTPINHTLHEGFIDHDLKICIYTDHQIFDRYHKINLKTDKVREARQTITMQELTRLNPGDYVVHIDHGIGRFGGLVNIEENGRKQEVVRLVYRDNDILLVSIHSLHRISKYKGQEGEPPKINKLGTPTWNRLKERTKKKVKDIARELIALYAKRKAEPGYSFSQDTFMQQELEASFIYEDTPDQAKATIAIKEDMEDSTPMDRLVCGDVGFGKTEIAIRAAFKAATDNKQVAILVPTTILALQHFHTFKRRLKDFPVRVEYISRMRKPSDVKKILSDTKEGLVDILIGTHRLVGKDVSFKDLGLLVIDEEQRFGVSVKEKLKKLKVNVDTLTLTATPIPRTLQFSLMGARDLSILNTPPANRQPINTELHTFNDDIIKEAITYEVERGGQVFFIHNRVKSITDVEIRLNTLFPKYRIVVAHGQMSGPELEKIMMDFINHEYDILIATTIIESGLDIPNANTIIIDNAHHFGLSELHQLRGRVGRSNTKSFCYLLAPPLANLTDDARRRLTTLSEFSELGSGFNIAMQDLDIRGAGDLLGAEQSGYISNIGYQTYQRILEEAMLELREEEFPELLPAEKEESGKKYVTECQIETDLNIRFPETYIVNTAERMELYRKLDIIKNFEKLEEFEKNLIDRFGELPIESKGLLRAIRLRLKAEEIGIEKITYKNRIVRIQFVSNKKSSFYQSQIFTNILTWVQKNSKFAKLEEKKGRLFMVITKAENLNSIIKHIDSISNI